MFGTDAYGLAPLAGGHSGETFLAESAGERSVVRVYGGRGAARGPAAVEIDAAVLRLVRGLVPVPVVLEARRADTVAGTPGLLVTSFLPGERLDLVLPELAAAPRERLGRRLGRIAARLAGMPMLTRGLFTDGELRIEPFPAADDLVEWVRRHRHGTALEAWSPGEYDALLGLADDGQTVLDATDRATLVHSDFNPRNLLVDPGTGAVTGVVDWEFAHAGHPATDLGNLLRFERDPDDPAFTEAALEGYLSLLSTADGGPGDTATLREQARAADLLALVELAARCGENPVTEEAHRLLLATARARDLHVVL